MVGRHHPLDGLEFEQTLRDREGRDAWRAAVHGIAKSQTLLSDWTTSYKTYNTRGARSLLCDDVEGLDLGAGERGPGGPRGRAGSVHSSGKPVHSNKENFK